MKLEATQIATKENGYGYSDYEMTVLHTPDLIIEMVLTIPFDKRENPYLRLILGDIDERFDMDMPSIPLTRNQASSILTMQGEPA
jgi:hypothetical protein